MQDPLQSVAADDRNFARFSMITVFFCVDGLAHAVFVNLAAWSALANSPTSGFGQFGSPSYRDPSRSFARHPTNHFRNTAKHESLVVMDHPLLGSDLLGSRESSPRCGRWGTEGGQRGEVMMLRGRVVGQELYPKRVTVVVDTSASPPSPGQRFETNKNRSGRRERNLGGI